MAAQLIDFTFVYHDRIRQKVAQDFFEMHNYLLALEDMIAPADPDGQIRFLRPLKAHMAEKYQEAATIFHRLNQ